MKTLPYYLLILVSILIISCSSEPVENSTSEEIEEDISDGETDNDGDDNDDDDDTDGNNDDDDDSSSSEPCDFSLVGLAPNSTVKINCVFDLKGETIQLPANTIFEFAGGEISNGTLVFSDNNAGLIDGRLLNSNLTIEGNAKLIGEDDPQTIFKFIPSKWINIVEGETTSDIALNNTAALENIMFFIKRMGVEIFEIEKFDAYFETTKVTSTTSNQNFYASVEAVNIPSNFHLKMSSNTYLRQYPAEAHIENGAILAVRDVSNVKVTGGNLIGDRDIRQYTSDDVGLQGTHLFHIHASKNITLDGINFIKGSKGGLSIYSLGFSFNPDYIPTVGVNIKNCKFKDIRRMGIALTDGSNIVIEENTFTNVGQPSTNSNGGEVGYAINVEAYRTRDSNGNLIENQKAYDIDIRRNKESNSRIGFVSVHIGQQVTIQDNDVSTRVVYSLASGTKILNNRFNANAGSNEQFAIFAAGSGETVFNNEVADNEISGYGIGVATDTKDVYVHGNRISNCKIGIQIKETLNSRFENNTIDALNHGISSTSTYVDNVDIVNNTITSTGFHVKFSALNMGADHVNYKVNLEDNKFFNTRKVSFFSTNGVSFKNNEVIGGIEIGDSSNIDISLNKKINPADSHGIRLYGDNSNIIVADNSISEPTGADRFQCIKNNSENPNAITLSGNTCN